MNSDLRFTLLFGAIRNIFKKRSDKGLKDMKLTSTQVSLLIYIHAHEETEVNQKDIEKNLYLQTSTVTDVLNRLENNGFLIRTTSEKDGRYKKITLTPKGKDIHDKMYEKALMFEKYFTKGLTKGESEILFELLQKVLNNLSE